MRYDIAIIGTGPAGISAAITAKLRNKNIILFGNKDLSDKINISPEISQILNNRGIDNEKDAEIFMNPSLEYLRDPFLMKDMKKATDRIKKL